MKALGQPGLDQPTGEVSNKKVHPARPGLCAVPWGSFSQVRLFIHVPGEQGENAGAQRRGYQLPKII